MPDTQLHNSQARHANSRLVLCTVCQVMYHFLPANNCCGRVHQTSKVTAQGRSLLYDADDQTHTNRGTDQTM